MGEHMNVYSLLADPIRRLPAHVALVQGGRSLDYDGFDRVASAAGRAFVGLGCAPGDRVVLFLKNVFEYPQLLLGAMRSGFVVVPVNAKLHPSEVAWIAGNCAARLAVVDPDGVDALATAMDGNGATQIVSSDALHVDPAAEPEPVAEVAPDAPAWIFYTSGTTGRPKGATLTHRNLIAASVNCLADICDFRHDDRVLHVAPLSHGSGLYLIPSLMRGATNIISDRAGFQPDPFFDEVAQRNVTVVAFVAPTMIVRMLEARPRADLGALRRVIYGGASIHLEHVRAAVDRFGPIFQQLYGQGEAPMTISGLPAADHHGADDETLLSAGHVRSGVEVRVVDEDGHVLHAGQDGEICVRGDVVMTGYWNNPDATAKAIRDGWLHTGDIGRFDAGGRLRLLDRRHDTIISGGTNIYPKEIEDVIASHPAVREVIAFGVPDREWGESVAVAIVTEPATSVSEADIVALCRQHLAAFKKPKHIRFVDALPQNAYGKVLRRDLRELFSRSGS